MRRTRAPRVVWGLVGLYALQLFVLSVVFPTYRAPDEYAHVDMVLAVTEHAGYPPVGARISQRVQASFAVVGYERTGDAPPLRAADAPARNTRPSFAELGEDVPGDVPQQMAAHPPLYYVTAASALSVVTALVPAAYDWSFDQVVGFLRLVSAVLMLPLPWLAHRVAVRLGAVPPVAVAAAVLPLVVPQLSHIGASVNNDTLLIVLLGMLVLPSVAVARGDTSMRTAVVAGLLGGLALLTKGFALFVPLWLAAAYGLAVVRGGGWGAAARGGLAAGLAVAVGGWWWIRNLVVFGTVQPSGLPGPAPPEGFAPEVWWWASFYVRRLSRRFWIEPDILPEALPALDLLASAILVALCVVALVACRRVGQRPGDVALVLTPLAGLLGIVTFGAWRVYARTGSPFAIHGRYLYGATVGLAVASAFGLAALARHRIRWLPIAALVTALLAQLSAGVLALLTYWGPTGLRPRLAAMLAWSPWPSPLVVLATASIVALAVWVAAPMLRDARRSARRAASRR